MKIYRGKRDGDGTEVTVDGEPLNMRRDLRDLHAESFEWGYQGSGPQQLAFAILVEHMGPEGALENYRRFTADAIAEIVGAEWRMSGQEIDDRLRHEIVNVPMDLETLMKKVRGEI